MALYLRCNEIPAGIFQSTLTRRSSALLPSFLAVFQSDENNFDQGGVVAILSSGSDRFHVLEADKHEKAVHSPHPVLAPSTMVPGGYFNRE